MSKSKNPFLKMIADQKRINEAIDKNIPLSSLEGITFISPLEKSKEHYIPSATKELKQHEYSNK